MGGGGRKFRLSFFSLYISKTSCCFSLNSFKEKKTWRFPHSEISYTEVGRRINGKEQNQSCHEKKQFMPSYEDPNNLLQLILSLHVASKNKQKQEFTWKRQAIHFSNRTANSGFYCQKEQAILSLSNAVVRWRVGPRFFPSQWWHGPLLL